MTDSQITKCTYIEHNGKLFGQMFLLHVFHADWNRDRMKRCLVSDTFKNNRVTKSTNFEL